MKAISTLFVLVSTLASTSNAADINTHFKCTNAVHIFNSTDDSGNSVWYLTRSDANGNVIHDWNFGYSRTFWVQGTDNLRNSYAVMQGDIQSKLESPKMLARCSQDLQNCTFTFSDFPTGVETPIWQGVQCQKGSIDAKVSSRPVKLVAAATQNINTTGRLIEFDGREFIDLRDQRLPETAPGKVEKLTFPLFGTDRYGDNINMDLERSLTVQEAYSGSLTALTTLRLVGTKSGEKYVGKSYIPFKPASPLGTFELTLY